VSTKSSKASTSDSRAKRVKAP